MGVDPPCAVLARALSQDIDLILDRGKKKTEEILGKLSNAEKGDMLDFKLDGKRSTDS
jgi:hypothetical protein